MHSLFRVLCVKHWGGRWIMWACYYRVPLPLPLSMIAMFRQYDDSRRYVFSLAVLQSIYYRSPSVLYSIQAASICMPFGMADEWWGIVINGYLFTVFGLYIFHQNIHTYCVCPSPQCEFHTSMQSMACNVKKKRKKSQKSDWIGHYII